MNNPDISAHIEKPTNTSLRYLMYSLIKKDRIYSSIAFLYHLVVHYLGIALSFSLLILKI